MAYKRNNFYRCWQLAESSGRRAAGRRLARAAAPAAAVVAVCLLGWGALTLHTVWLRGETDTLNAWCEASGAAYAESLADRTLAERLQADAGLADELHVLLDSYPDPTGQLLQTLESASGSVQVRLRSYSAASGVLGFDAVSPQVIDIPAYVRRLQATGLFDTVQYSGYGSGSGGYRLQLNCVLAAPAGEETP